MGRMTLQGTPTATTLGGDVSGHHAAGADDRVFSDPHAGENHRTRANPDVVLNIHRDVELGHLPAEAGFHRMAGGGDGDIGTEHHIAAHVDVGVVHQGQVKVGVDVVPKVGVSAPVARRGGST